MSGPGGGVVIRTSTDVSGPQTNSREVGLDFKSFGRKSKHSSRGVRQHPMELYESLSPWLGAGINEYMHIPPRQSI